MEVLFWRIVIVEEKTTILGRYTTNVSVYRRQDYVGSTKLETRATTSVLPEETGGCRVNWEILFSMRDQKRKSSSGQWKIARKN